MWKSRLFSLKAIFLRKYFFLECLLTVYFKLTCIWNVKKNVGMSDKYCSVLMCLVTWQLFQLLRQKKGYRGTNNTLPKKEFNFDQIRLDGQFYTLKYLPYNCFQNLISYHNRRTTGQSIQKYIKYLSIFKDI